MYNQYFTFINQIGYKPMEKRVVVTGLGIVTSNGGNVDEFTNAIMAGKSVIKLVVRLEVHNFTCEGAVWETLTFSQTKSFLKQTNKKSGK
jgi:3-oxoacyl-(acyl-carrier-protein) synthase